MSVEQPRIEYVEARRVLLDALTALQPHIGAIVLIGAQAVYLRTAGRISTYQPFTTDADLALDPSLLADIPLLGDAMLDAGFELTSEPGIWQQRFQRPGFDGDITVPVDLIVPAELVSKAGRRGARLPGEHGKTAARKSEGVAGAIVDFDPFEITSFEADDDRTCVVNVAGPAALLVAKAHKLGERIATPERLIPKDAGDIYRLFDATSVEDMAAVTMQLLADERSSTAARGALGLVRQLFATPRSPGIDLAIPSTRRDHRPSHRRYGADHIHQRLPREHAALAQALGLAAPVGCLHGLIVGQPAMSLSSIATRVGLRRCSSRKPTRYA